MAMPRFMSSTPRVGSSPSEGSEMMITSTHAQPAKEKGEQAADTETEPPPEEA